MCSTCMDKCWQHTCTDNVVSAMLVHVCVWQTVTCAGLGGARLPACLGGCRARVLGPDQSHAASVDVRFVGAGDATK